jgi:hypothetical protein
MSLLRAINLRNHVNDIVDKFGNARARPSKPVEIFIDIEINRAGVHHIRDNKLSY